MEYARTVYSSEIERKILTGMIISTPYLRDVAGMVNPRLFKIDYIRRIVSWVLDYYKQYKEAPNKDFESIFYAQSTKLNKQAEVELMEEFLQSLSDQYIENDNKTSFNKELLFDQTVDFCRDRQLEILHKTVEGHRLSGDLAKAEEAVAGFGKIAQNVSRWINPFDTKQINKVFENNDANRLFKMPGALGEMIGYFERGWLVGILGPAKRGKSWHEWEFAFHALCAKLKVVVFEFEMNEQTYQKRIHKRITAMNEIGGEFAYPTFDCLFNQNGQCKKPERTNTIRLDVGGKIPAYTPNMEYRPCVACRGTKDFYPVSWWQTQRQRNDMSPGIVIKKAKTFKKLYGDNLRIRCFPSFSAGFPEVEAELENLKNQENFEPDVILFDYLDIMSAEVANELEDENRKWKRAKGLAGERHCLVINCHQGNRESEEMRSIRQKHTGGSIKKLQHLDIDITLNQSEEEQRRGKIRMQVLVHRHEEGISKGEVIVLQQLKLGQPLLDSEWRPSGK
jgi:replicative DNA helicase